MKSQFFDHKSYLCVAQLNKHLSHTKILLAKNCGLRDCEKHTEENLLTLLSNYQPSVEHLQLEYISFDTPDKFLCTIQNLNNIVSISFINCEVNCEVFLHPLGRLKSLAFSGCNEFLIQSFKYQNTIESVELDSLNDNIKYLKMSKLTMATLPSAATLRVIFGEMNLTTLYYKDIALIVGGIIQQNVTGPFEFGTSVDSIYAMMNIFPHISSVSTCSGNLNKLRPSLDTIIDCKIVIKSNEDILELLTCMPNLEVLRLKPSYRPIGHVLDKFLPNMKKLKRVILDDDDSDTFDIIRKHVPLRSELLAGKTFTMPMYTQIETNKTMGRHYVASCDIPAYTCILQEDCLVWGYSLRGTRIFSTGERTLYAKLKDTFAELYTKEEQKHLESIYTGTDKLGYRAFTELAHVLKLCTDTSTWDQRCGRLYSITRANVFGYEDKEYLFAYGSIFSHDCNPNSFYFIEDSKMYVVTNQAIKAGDIVSISYHISTCPYACVVHDQLSSKDNLLQYCIECLRSSDNWWAVNKTHVMGSKIGTQIPNENKRARLGTE